MKSRKGIVVDIMSGKKTLPKHPGIQEHHQSPNKSWYFNNGVSNNSYTLNKGCIMYQYDMSCQNRNTVFIRQPFPVASMFVLLSFCL